MHSPRWACSSFARRWQLAPPQPPPPSASSAAAGATELPCPAEMVLVAEKFCMDRFEATLFDGVSGEALSTDFSPTPGMFDLALAEWATGRWYAGDLHARAWPLPK